LLLCKQKRRVAEEGISKKDRKDAEKKNMKKRKEREREEEVVGRERGGEM
jgi:hypothetical protein